jgi:hypothetical protein
MARTTSTNWPGPGDGENFDLIPDGAELPREVTGRVTKRWLAAWFFCLLITGATGKALVTVLGMFPGGGRGLIPAVVGVALLIAGWMSSRRSHLRLTSEEVECTDVSRLRGMRWREPVSAYRGVLRRVRSGKGMGRLRVLSETVLQHPYDVRKHVKLSSADSEDGFIERHRRHARTFRLPALTETEEGIEAAPFEKVEEPLVARSTGGPQADAVLPASPPGDLSVDVQGAAVAMRTRRSTSRSTLVIGLLSPVWCAWMISAMWVGTAGIPGIIRAVMAVSTAVLLLLTAFCLGCATIGLTVRQVLRVTPKRVESWHEVGERAFGRVSLGAREIEAVTLQKQGQHPLSRALGLRGPMGNSPCGPTVAIYGSREAIAFGHVLSKESRRWVRACVLSILAAGDPGKAD